jgi:hypothetical protein
MRYVRCIAPSPSYSFTLTLNDPVRYLHPSPPPSSFPLLGYLPVSAFGLVMTFYAYIFLLIVTS